MRSSSALCSAIVLMLSIAAAGQMSDWPQWGGPTRDFKVATTGLVATWPEAGPRRIWSPLGASIVAFDRKDGSIVWKRHDFKHAYVLMATAATASSSSAARTPPTVREVWGTQRIRFHFTNAIRIGDVIYGSSGDVGPAFFTALDARSGAVIWQDRRLPRGSFVYADGRFILVGEDGMPVLATPSPQSLTINAQAQVLESNAWTPPTLVGTMLYLRDRKSIMAIDLR